MRHPRLFSSLIVAIATLVTHKAWAGGAQDGGDALRASSSTAASVRPYGSACRSVTESSLDGVKIRFRMQRCAWTRVELRQGIVLEYQIAVDSANAPDAVQPWPQDAGGCGRPGPSGLILFHRISNDRGDRYCLCDEGMCAPLSSASGKLVDGVHNGSFEWHGRNWMGPSDVGFDKGDPFTTGPSKVMVSAKGTTLNGERFEVSAEMTITVLP